MSRHGLVAVFTVLQDFFYWGVFHHSVWFVCLVGVVSVTPYHLICLAPSGRLHQWGAWRPPPLRFSSYGALAWYFLGDPRSIWRCSSPVEFPGVLTFSVLSALVWKWCFCHLLCCIVNFIAVRLIDVSLLSPVLWGCLFPDAYLAHLLYFWLSDRMRRLDILLISNLLLFDSQLSLLLSLLSVVGG